jgi:phosphoserine phosphatase RsbU/P
LNSTLSERIIRGMFVTTIVGRIIPSGNRIELASAGHCKPVMLRADGSAFEIETDGSLPLGILARVAYRQGKIDIHPGDWFVCYTDGLSESKNSADEVFEQKIISSIAGRKFESPRMVVEHLIERERVHRGTRRQNDDLTILVGGLT